MAQALLFGHISISTGASRIISELCIVKTGGFLSNSAPRSWNEVDNDDTGGFGSSCLGCTGGGGLLGCNCYTGNGGNYQWTAVDIGAWSSCFCALPKGVADDRYRCLRRQCVW